MVLIRNRLAGFLPDVTSKREPSTPGMDHPLGEDRRCSDQGWRERFPRGQRVLDGLPGARVGGWL